MANLRNSGRRLSFRRATGRYRWQWKLQDCFTMSCATWTFSGRSKNEHMTRGVRRWTRTCEIFPKSAFTQSQKTNKTKIEERHTKELLVQVKALCNEDTILKAMIRLVARWRHGFNPSDWQHAGELFHKKTWGKKRIRTFTISRIEKQSFF